MSIAHRRQEQWAVRHVQGQPLAGKIVFTDTFVRHGDWKAVASHRTASQ
jgi:hypothetical protein